jgi:ABC-type lipoprotein export system ATPase subunit
VRSGALIISHPAAQRAGWASSKPHPLSVTGRTLAADQSRPSNLSRAGVRQGPGGGRYRGHVTAVHARRRAEQDGAFVHASEPPVLQVNGVIKRVGRGRAARQILCGVDLAVHRGEMVAVLGRSGSGKTTLLHLLGGLDRPDAGSITVGGESLTGASERALSRIRLRRLGFVFQSFQLIEELTGAENVLLAARLPGAPEGGCERTARLIEELGVATVAHRAPHELSGGEQQRFAIARALVNDPALILADEATGNLDTDSGAMVLELLHALTTRGCAVVLVTHEPQAAAAADRVLRLTGGRLESAGEETRSPSAGRRRRLAL